MTNSGRALAQSANPIATNVAAIGVPNQASKPWIDELYVAE
jgi:hypothetical protein